MADRIDYGYETWSEKFKRKFNENPWVPLGCLATTGALLMASIKMRAGKSKDMQYWLRARVGLQGLTLVALVAGSMAIQAQRKAQVADAGIADDVPRNEATTELLREQKKGKEKAEFEERLKDAEIAHLEERAAVARVLANAQGFRDSSSMDEPNTEQTTTSGDVKGGSSWRRWPWGSRDDSSKKQ